MKAPKNVVFISVDSLWNTKEVPVLKIKVHLPEIVLDGYRIRKNTKNIFLTVDTSKESEFIICSDYTLLEEHTESINIVKDKMKDYRIGKIIQSSYPEAVIDILNGLVVKMLVNYTASTYKDYDGFNVNLDPTDPRFISVSDIEEKKHSGEVIKNVSETLIKWLEE